MRVETTILKSLIKNEDYARKVLPFLKKEYFESSTEAKLYQNISDFYLKYNAPPTMEALSVDVHKSASFKDFEVKEAEEVLKNMTAVSAENSNQNWLIDATEKFCQERALYNAISKSINIMDGKDKVHDKGAIPTLLQEALGVCFDANVGLNYMEDSDRRYEYYHANVKKIPFDLEMMNKITKGGVARKTLNVVMAGTGIGKSIWLCHQAANYLSQGLNVLYVSLEMSEDEIAKRIDANLLNIRIDDLLILPKADYDRRIEKLKGNVKAGNIFIKEYPTAGASVLHVENLLNELFLKQSFKPDVIIIDYLNIMLSSRVKSGTTNMYGYVKSITEEVRGLAVKFNVPIWSATQVNRGGFSDSDPGMDATSESFGLPMTVDLLIILISSDQLVSLGQLMVKQLKNRYADVNKDQKFVLALDKDKMRFENPAADDVKASAPIVRSKTGEREELPWEEYRDRLEADKNKKNITTGKASNFSY